jgi:di/tricarboxylate transporter
MSDFFLQHKHEPSECDSAFAAWRSFDSPLRGTSAPSTCLAGGHRIWWLVEATNPAGALALLPGFVASRTEVTAVRYVEVP